MCPTFNVLFPVEIPGLCSTAFSEFLQGEQKNCNNRREPHESSQLCLRRSQRWRVNDTDGPLTSAMVGQRDQDNYIRFIHHLLAWGGCAFPQLINTLRVRLAVRVQCS